MDMTTALHEAKARVRSPEANEAAKMLGLTDLWETALTMQRAFEIWFDADQATRGSETVSDILNGRAKPYSEEYIAALAASERAWREYDDAIVAKRAAYQNAKST